MKNTTRLQPELFLSSRRTFTGFPANRLLLLASLSIVLSACGGGSGSAENAAGSTQNTTDQQQVSIESPAEATSEPAPDVDELALGEALAAEFQTEFDSQQTTGFSALLLDDGSVQLDWVPAAFAESYQVFRNDELIAETAEPQIIDHAIQSGDNVYRVVALDDGNQTEVIANGLNVELSEDLSLIHI